ncbi:MAG: hypothetical protein WB384_23410 [Candidatus Sulfotelmatobacter sp.]
MHHQPEPLGTIVNNSRLATRVSDAWIICTPDKDPAQCVLGTRPRLYSSVREGKTGEDGV